jgi:hypothetical protein
MSNAVKSKWRTLGLPWRPRSEASRNVTVKPTVYRLEEVPGHTSKDDLKDLFKPACQGQIEVTSLSRAADWNEINGTLTATFLFTPKDPHDKPKLLVDQPIIDSDFYGFTALYTPDGTIDADIIAITGLTGHAYGSLAVSAERMWLRDISVKSALPILVESKAMLVSIRYSSALPS